MSPKVIHIFSDASKLLGYAAILGNKWFSMPWPSVWWTEQNIVLLELVPIVLALEIWGHTLRDNVVLLHTDNMALVSVINNQKSKEPLVMLLVRSLVFNSLLHNVSLKAIHIPGFLNVDADLLSRQQVPKFLARNAEVDATPAQLPRLPDQLLSSTKHWAWPTPPSPTRLQNAMQHH